MGGSVTKTIGKAAAIIASPVAATASLVGGVVKDGAAGIKAPVKDVVSGVKSGISVGKEFAQDVGALPPDPEVPNIAADDPGETAEQARLAKARARRQAEVDLLTGQPGRGGTILTDNYNYQV